MAAVTLLLTVRRLSLRLWAPVGGLGHGMPCPYILLLIFVVLLLAAGCSGGSDAPQIEEAYAAREDVGLREELKPNAPVVATLALGERVEVVERRRRFVRVRTGAGVSGWTRDSRLATRELRRKMDQIGQQTRSEPSQGTYRALYRLNIHLEPYRWSPTIYQLEEDEEAELLRHQLVDRLPRPPEDGKPPPSPTGLDDWYLVRAPNGEAGWALTTGLYSAVPDEVKQYAERKRITSFFALGAVEDGRQAQPKTTWFWTQIDRPKQTYDFSLIRVFMWSRGRQAYGTIKLERGLTGYLPVRMHKQLETERGTGPGFTITVEKKGERLDRTYVLVAHRVYRVEEKPAGPPPPRIRFVKPEMPVQTETGIVDRVTGWWQGG